uniref:Uncharacterized protein n=1 Tax=Mesocestoides corti TaxID=53468 RepID=A0A5K3FYJ9_MESCO
MNRSIVCSLTTSLCTTRIHIEDTQHKTGGRIFDSSIWSFPASCHVLRRADLVVRAATGSRVTRRYAHTHTYRTAWGHQRRRQCGPRASATQPTVKLWQHASSCRLGAITSTAEVSLAIQEALDALSWRGGCSFK